MAIKYTYGNYVGNGVDNRNIPGFNLTDFGWMIVTRGTEWMLRFASMVGDYSIGAQGSGSVLNKIQSVFPVALNFQIGTDLEVNNNGSVYYFYGFGNDSAFQSGTYAGNGMAGRTILTPGMTPVFVIVIETGGVGQTGVWRTSAMPGDATFAFNSGTGYFAGGITSLAAGGFVVGNDARVNNNGGTYHWLAFGTDNTKIAVGSYIGDNTDNRNIAISPPLTPVLVIVKRQASANFKQAVLRLKSPSGDNSSLIASGWFGDMIQAFNIDGFQVGTDYAVNGNDGGGPSVNTYYWVAIAAELQDPNPLAGYSAALPVACGHSLISNPIAQN